MPKYLIQASYTREGVRGLVSEGGSSRRAEVEKLAKAMGGTLEALYYAFGEHDVVVIMDVPDNVTMAALSLSVAATGAIRVKTTVLLTPEEIDQAAKKVIPYRPPGG